MSLDDFQAEIGEVLRKHDVPLAVLAFRPSDVPPIVANVLVSGWGDGTNNGDVEKLADVVKRTIEDLKAAAI